MQSAARWKPEVMSLRDYSPFINIKIRKISVGRAVSILWKRTRKGIINLVQDLCQFVKYIKKKHGLWTVPHTPTNTTSPTNTYKHTHTHTPDLTFHWTQMVKLNWGGFIIAIVLKQIMHKIWGNKIIDSKNYLRYVCVIVYLKIIRQDVWIK